MKAKDYACHSKGTGQAKRTAAKEEPHGGMRERERIKSKGNEEKVPCSLRRLVENNQKRSQPRTENG